MKVRFHLGGGENFMKWQVRDGRRVEYHDPDKVSLTLRGCRLRNAPGVAKRIHGGANKSVCAWIECESVEVSPRRRRRVGAGVYFNPRVAPHWRDANGRNIDGARAREMRTAGRSVVAAKGGLK